MQGPEDLIPNLRWAWILSSSLCCSWCPLQTWQMPSGHDEGSGKPGNDQLWLGFQGLVFLSPTSLLPPDSTQRPPPALLPTHMAPLAFLPVSGQPDCRQCCPTLCFCGDPRQLLLHSQHLAYAHRWQRGLLAAPTCQD